MEIRAGDILFTFIPSWETSDDYDITIITKIIAIGNNECLTKSIYYSEEEDGIKISSQTKVLLSPKNYLNDSYLVEKDIWEKAKEDLEKDTTHNFSGIKNRFKKLIEYLHS